MSFTVLCPRFRQPLSVQESQTGQAARCPRCTTAFQIPAPLAPPAPRPAAVQRPPAPAPAPRKPAAPPRKT